MTVLGAMACAAAVVCAVTAAFAPLRVGVALPHPEARYVRVALPGWSLYRWEALRAAVVVVALLLRVPLVIVVLLAAAPSLAVRYRADVLDTRAAVASISVLQATNAALRSGVALATALRLAGAAVDAPAFEPFRGALHAADLNRDLAATLAESRRAVRDARVAIALDALSIVASQELPASRAAAVIGAVADRLAFEQRVREEIDARASGVRWQIALLAVLVPGLATYLVLTMPALAATLSSTLGTHVLVPMAAFLELAGIVASRAVVRGLAL